MISIIYIMAIVLIIFIVVYGLAIGMYFLKKQRAIGWLTGEQARLDQMMASGGIDMNSYTAAKSQIDMARGYVMNKRMFPAYGNPFVERMRSLGLVR